jgi:hypothetical protein
MTKQRFFLYALALVSILAWNVSALAADAAATPAQAAPSAQPAAPTPIPVGTPAVPAKHEGKQKGNAEGKNAGQAKAKTEVKCEVSGKLAEKTAKNKKGKEVKVFDLTVASAKAADGKALDALNGKSVRVVRKEGVKLTDYVGKDVTITGTLVNNRRLIVDAIK